MLGCCASFARRGEVWMTVQVDMVEGGANSTELNGSQIFGVF